MEILKQGKNIFNNPKYKAACPRCGCEFIFKKSETTYSQKDMGDIVTCPTCGLFIDVVSDNVTPLPSLNTPDKDPNTYTRKEVEEILKGFVDVVANFNRRPWFKDKDMDEWMPFLTGYLKDKGFHIMPCGSAWAYAMPKESVERYLGENQHLFDSYWDWAATQR